MAIIDAIVLYSLVHILSSYIDGAWNWGAGGQSLGCP